MVQILLIVIGVYALAAVMVHISYWLVQGKLRTRKHYVLVADSEEQHLEWYMRSLSAFSRWMGKDVRLTVVDRGSSLEAATIASRLNDGVPPVVLGKDDEQGDGLLWQLQSQGIVKETEHAVLIDLQRSDDLSKLPF